MDKLNLIIAICMVIACIFLMFNNGYAAVVFALFVVAAEVEKITTRNGKE